MTLKDVLLAKLQQFRSRLESLPPAGYKVPAALINEHNSLVEEYEALRNADASSLRAKLNDPPPMLVTKIEAMISELTGS